MTTIRTKRRGFATTLLATVAVTTALAGCSAASSRDDGGAGAGGGRLESGDPAAVYAEWSDKFDGCMKDKGFDLSTLSDSAVPNADAEGVNEAADTCYEKIGNPPPDPSVPSVEEINEQMLAFAKCMRKAGYDYPDPKIDPNGGVAMGQAMPADWDTADVDRCSKEAGMLDGGQK